MYDMRSATQIWNEMLAEADRDRGRKFAGRSQPGYAQHKTYGGTLVLEWKADGTKLWTWNGDPVKRTHARQIIGFRS